MIWSQIINSYFLFLFLKELHLLLMLMLLFRFLGRLTIKRAFQFCKRALQLILKKMREMRWEEEFPYCVIKCILSFSRRRFFSFSHSLSISRSLSFFFLSFCFKHIYTYTFGKKKEKKKKNKQKREWIKRLTPYLIFFSLFCRWKLHSLQLDEIQRLYC